MGPDPNTNQWVNAVRLPNGDWLIKKADNPTSDQIKFKANYDTIHGIFWGTLSEDKQLSFASKLTDRGFNLADKKIDIFSLYLKYKDLLALGTVKGNTAEDFINWMYDTQPKSKLPPIEH